MEGQDVNGRTGRVDQPGHQTTPGGEAQPSLSGAPPIIGAGTPPSPLPVYQQTRCGETPLSLSGTPPPLPPLPRLAQPSLSGTPTITGAGTPPPLSAVNESQPDRHEACDSDGRGLAGISRRPRRVV